MNKARFHIVITDTSDNDKVLMDTHSNVIIGAVNKGTEKGSEAITFTAANVFDIANTAMSCVDIIKDISKDNVAVGAVLAMCIMKNMHDDNDREDH